MRIAAMTTLIGLMALPAAAQTPSEPTGLLALERHANELCRGMSGDNPETASLCEVRDDLVRRLRSVGWCYGQRGEISAQMRWHRCNARSNQN
ncbi:MAG TPA: hypothetical protein VGM87_06455 [Roseomonas sp.]